MQTSGSDLLRERTIRICRPAFQDMHHLVAPRLVARMELRRHALKLRFWTRGDRSVGDLECEERPDGLYFLTVSDGYGIADGFRIVFFEDSAPEPLGTIWVLSVMRFGEELSSNQLDILRGRKMIARVRSSGWFPDLEQQ